MDGQVIYDLRFTMYDVQFTTYDLRIAIYAWVQESKNMMESDMTLEKVLKTIEIDAQFDLAIQWLEYSLPIWNEYSKKPGELSWYDGVGNHYEIEASIIKNSIDAIKGDRSSPGSRINDVRILCDRIYDCVICITRMDWEPPDAIDRIISSTFNILQIIANAYDDAKAEKHLNLAINQAADALIQGKIKTINDLNEELRVIKTNNRKPTESPDGAAS